MRHLVSKTTSGKHLPQSIAILVLGTLLVDAAPSLAAQPWFTDAASPAAKPAASSQFPSKPTLAQTLSVSTLRPETPAPSASFSDTAQSRTSDSISASEEDAAATAVVPSAISSRDAAPAIAQVMDSEVDNSDGVGDRGVEELPAEGAIEVNGDATGLHETEAVHRAEAANDADEVTEEADAMTAPAAPPSESEMESDAAADETSSVISQAEEPQPAPDTVSVSAADLTIPSRFGVIADTGPNGFDDAVGLHAFVPLNQDPGENVTFLEGDIELRGGDPSFSLNLGHRGYDAEHDRIRGGYIGVDGRSTDENMFFQLAAGYERIQDDWEFRINGYLPVGDRTQTIRDVTVDSGFQTAQGFQSNQLVLSSARERQRILEQENALGGFDAEVGTQLTAWNGGELMGYVGGYLLSGEESSLGGQLRIAANFESNFNAGLALQHDGLFGTSLTLSVSAAWPNIRFQGEDEAEFQEENEVPIRLRDPIARRQNVAVNIIDDVETFSESTVAPLRNPEEEQDYRFIHVALSRGAGAGDGTYENPFGTVEDAIALVNSDPTTFSDGNTVIYVDGENAPGVTIPSFIIPERVRVLSQGPNQIIAGMPFPGFPSTPTRLPFSPEQNFNVAAEPVNANGITVALPDANDGVFPTITGGTSPDLVTLGNRTILAGFQINGAPQHGVAGSQVDDVELRNNLIVSSGGSGIFFDNVGGSAILFDNVVDSAADRGILVQNSLTAHPIEVDIAGFDVSNSRVGMEFVATATAGAEFPSQIVSIGPSTSANTSVGTPNGTAPTSSILNSTGEGLVVQSSGNDLFATANQEVTVTATTINGSGADSVRLIAENGAHQQIFDFIGGVITNSTGGNGITIRNGEFPSGTTRSATAQEITILDSEISSNAGNGIDIVLADAGAQELVIQGNQIVNNAGDGIHSVSQTVALQEWRTNNETGELGVSNNVISGNGGQAIVISLENLGLLPIVGIGNNDLSGNGIGPDIEITSTSSAAPGACVILTTNVTPNGIRLTGPDPTLTSNIPGFLVQDLPSLLANPNVTLQAVDFFGTITASNAPFINETNRCIL
ncbi:hypothetical protein PN498_26085 [Oscillatoria sp. CS-180]|uniref:hypothetical protein n=1 Tax=Oscillatoria sp. CS-180 TaxID=3021720 RepID=UPI00232E0882|nr:hypothetical protein [Oscillatoria sp. CS-180]MDB9529487.1 hypothetical protein [Oscillatoria sp. CS-180]